MATRGNSNNSEKKKPVLYIRTFGCQMNARDSEFVMGAMLENGFRQAKSVESSDIILFNSCSVREHAENRLFSNIGDLADLKKRKPGIIIGLMGCTAQNYKGGILQRVPIVDLVVGPGNESDIPALIKDILKNRCPMVAADKVDEKRPEIFPEYRDTSFKTYVSIGEGCNNYCSYCIVPYVRGKERSRDAKDIIKEVKNLATRGFKEITLLGQNVNSYRGSTNFAKLLERLNSIKGIERIRFMTSHPKDASIELFKAMKDLEKVCEHLHLPLQSGSGRILKLMNRGYTPERYLDVAASYKKIIPHGAITTDIIVGFPTETKRDFNKTLDMIKRIRFDSAFTFKYSPRPPALSAKLEDDVPPEAKEEWLKTLIGIQLRISEELNSKMKGETCEVLVDGFSKKDASKVTGRTRMNKTVVFKGAKGILGKIVRVKIDSVTPYTLKGEMVK